MDVMISDLPHINYHPKNTLTREQEENRMIIARHERDKIKKNGLKGLSGLKLSFSKQIIDGNKLLDEMEKRS